MSRKLFFIFLIGLIFSLACKASSAIETPTITVKDVPTESATEPTPAPVSVTESATETPLPTEVVATIAIATHTPTATPTPLPTATLVPINLGERFFQYGCYLEGGYGLGLETLVCWIQGEKLIVIPGGLRPNFISREDGGGLVYIHLLDGGQQLLTYLPQDRFGRLDEQGRHILGTHVKVPAEFSRITSLTTVIDQKIVFGAVVQGQDHLYVADIELDIKNLANAIQISNVGYDPVLVKDPDGNLIAVYLDNFRDGNIVFYAVRGINSDFVGKIKPASDIRGSVEVIFGLDNAPYLIYAAGPVGEGTVYMYDIRNKKEYKLGVGSAPTVQKIDDQRVIVLFSQVIETTRRISGVEVQLDENGNVIIGAEIFLAEGFGAQGGILPILPYTFPLP